VALNLVSRSLKNADFTKSKALFPFFSNASFSSQNTHSCNALGLMVAKTKSAASRIESCPSPMLLKNDRVITKPNVVNTAMLCHGKREGRGSRSDVTRRKHEEMKNAQTARTVMFGLDGQDEK